MIEQPVHENIPGVAVAEPVTPPTRLRPIQKRAARNSEAKPRHVQLLLVNKQLSTEQPVQQNEPVVPPRRGEARLIPIQNVYTPGPVSAPPLANVYVVLLAIEQPLIKQLVPTD